MDKKYYKIVYGFNQDNYFEITSDELHKAHVIAVKGGGASFESGFFRNRGQDVLRIEPDWHRVKGWNRTHKMDEFDYQEVSSLVEPYRKTLSNGKELAKYIIHSNRQELLNLPASEAFKEMKKQIESPKNKQLSDEAQKLGEKFKLNG